MSPSTGSEYHRMDSSLPRKTSMSKAHFKSGSYTLAALVVVLICTACASRTRSAGSGHVILASTAQADLRAEAPQPPLPSVPAPPRSHDTPIPRRRYCRIPRRNGHILARWSPRLTHLVRARGPRLGRAGDGSLPADLTARSIRFQQPPSEPCLRRTMILPS